MYKYMYFFVGGGGCPITQSEILQTILLVLRH